MIDAAFWRTMSARFAALRRKSLRESGTSLEATYHPEGWPFDDAGTFRGRLCGRWLLGNRTPSVVAEFKSVAAVCAVALEAPGGDDAWIEWLDYLRRESLDFRPRAHTTTTSRFLERRPDPDFELLARGLLTDPIEARPEVDYESSGTTIAEIADICTASEHLCSTLADDRLKLEIDAARSGARVPSPESSSHIERDALEPGHGSTDVTPEPCMTLQEAADALLVHPDTLGRMRDRDEVRMSKVGSQWRVPKSEVARLSGHPKFKYRD